MGKKLTIIFILIGLYVGYRMLLGVPILPTLSSIWTTYTVPVSIEMQTPPKEINGICYMNYWEDNDRDYNGYSDNGVCIPGDGNWTGTLTVGYRGKWVGRIKYLLGVEEHINIGTKDSTPEFVAKIPIKRGLHHFNLSVTYYNYKIEKIYRPNDPSWAFGYEIKRTKTGSYIQKWDVKTQTLDKRARFRKHIIPFNF